MARKGKGLLTFQQKLVLNQWFLALFGTDSLENLAKHLKDERLEGYDGENVSRFCRELTNRLPVDSGIRPEDLLAFDENIFRHTERLNRGRRGKEKIRWKYFQYLALLFTEIYLDRYFRDPSELREGLNEYICAFNGRNEPADHVEPFLQSDLSRITFFQATGSGKTLLMHINIMQYRHYLKRANREHELNRVILLTPNEGLSMQHLGEFEASGMHAVLFEKERNMNLFAGLQIEIIDIHKLGDRMGDKTVAVEAFEGGNLVLVDEGHRGSSGEEWMKRRNQLSKDGFTFEYSATFEQAVAASKDRKLEQQYAKSILFNYSYRYFYYDGFGKDYRILNLDDSKDVDYANRTRYLAACVLTFYQQMRFFDDNQHLVRKFNLDKPLLVLVGGRVTKSLSNKEASDVIEFLLFLGKFLKNEQNSVQEIKTILRGTHGLFWEDRDIFSEAFTYLQHLDENPAEIFSDIKRRVFNSDQGFLMVEHLKGSDGEIALSLGDARPFGVINVGNPKKLTDLCRENNEDVMGVRDREFADSYFTKINERNSSINLLIGSKKFTEGWNSWRVSTMGLMNVGKREGSEIIQLFGRGVRLKGFNFGLKRSSEVPDINPPKHMNKLETLNIFGVRAGYMKQFSEFLEKEGLSKDSDFRDIVLPVLCHYDNQKKLRAIRLKDGLDYKKHAPRPVLAFEHNYFRRHKVIVDWYPKIQAKISPDAEAPAEMMRYKQNYFSKDHLAFLDINKILFDLESHKNRHGWHTLNLPRERIRDLLLDHSWYEIKIPDERMNFGSNMASDILRWQEIASALLKKYLERFYKLKRSRWEQRYLEYWFLDKEDRNLLWDEDSGQHQYIVSVDAKREDLIERVTELKKSITSGNPRSFELDNFKVFSDSRHLYEPLIYLGEKAEYLKVKPVALNEGEKHFVESLTKYAQQHGRFFRDKEMYLLRNQSRGVGFGFFNEGGFYPDFILWILWKDRQYISFVDPHGMLHSSMEDPKLNFYQKIKEIEKDLYHYDDRITLNSFIISTTPYHSSWWGSDYDIEEFHNRNGFFQKEDCDSYVREIVDRSLRQ